MFNYILRRLAYSVPIVFGVMLITFFLFFVVQPPDKMARKILGPKATPQQVQTWLHNRGYDKPLFINRAPEASWHDSLFVNQMVRLAKFDLGISDVSGERLGDVFRRGAIPSLCITVPAFFAGLCLAVGIALYLVFVRYSALDFTGTIICVALMSVPIMVFVIFGQWLNAVNLNYFPAFGFELRGWSTAKFIALPVILMVVGGIGADIRIYRTIFLEEIGHDYVRTAKAKGVSNSRLLLVHVLKNGLIGLITLVVSSLPFLVMGSLVIENFFGIPGLGNLLASALQTGDFAVVRASVFLGSLMYLSALILTDICYAIADPRIRLS